MNNRLLILGANGMLGASLLRHLTKLDEFEVFGTVRNDAAKKNLNDQGFDNLISKIDAYDFETVALTIRKIRPAYVLNCIGIIKQLDASKAPVDAVVINSLLPHQLASECDAVGAKLIHFSTDCVFSGRVGFYAESDIPDAIDIYGRSKLLGEVAYGEHLTLRTSIIGHELGRSLSLVDWFLSQSKLVWGYQKAIFSGLPTVCVAEFLVNYVFEKNLSGLYHLSADPIDKYSLLSLINDFYSSGKEILPTSDFVIDRSLNSSRLSDLTGYIPDSWPKQIEKMRREYLAYFV